MLNVPSLCVFIQQSGFIVVSVQQPGAHPSPASAPLLLRLFILFWERERGRERSRGGTETTPQPRETTLNNFLRTLFFNLILFPVYAVSLRQMGLLLRGTLRVLCSLQELKWRCAWRGNALTPCSCRGFLSLWLKHVSRRLGEVWELKCAQRHWERSAIRDVNPAPSCWAGEEKKKKKKKLSSQRRVHVEPQREKPRPLESGFSDVRVKSFPWSEFDWFGRRETLMDFLCGTR